MAPFVRIAVGNPDVSDCCGFWAGWAMGAVLGSSGAACKGEADHHVWLVMTAVIRGATEGIIQSSLDATADSQHEEN